MNWAPAPSYTFEDHNDGMAFMRQNKPPAGMKWGIDFIQTGEDEYSRAVVVTAIEKWPIDDEPRKGTAGKYGDDDKDSPIDRCPRCGGELIRSDGQCENCDW